MNPYPKINFTIKYISADCQRCTLEQFKMPIPHLLVVFTILKDTEQTYLCEVLNSEKEMAEISITLICEISAIAIRTLVADNELIEGVLIMADSGLIELSTSIVSGLHVAKNDRSFANCNN